MNCNCTYAWHSADSCCVRLYQCVLASQWQFTSQDYIGYTISLHGICAKVGFIGVLGYPSIFSTVILIFMWEIIAKWLTYNVWHLHQSLGLPFGVLNGNMFLMHIHTFPRDKAAGVSAPYLYLVLRYRVCALSVLPWHYIRAQEWLYHLMD